jgi:hypothetical protein
VTMLELCTTEEQRYVVPYLWAQGLTAKYIHNEMFPVYGGKCLSLKDLQNCIENRVKISLMTKRLKRRCGSG